MEYRFRDETYLFTVTACAEGERFFAAMRAEKPEGVRFVRYGRNRDRSLMGCEIRKQGRVPLDLSDRWDLYIKINPNISHNYFNKNFEMHRAFAVLEKSAVSIGLNQSIIEYANERYKNILEPIFNNSKTPLIMNTPVITHPTTVTTSKWNCDIQIRLKEFNVAGDTKDDLERALKAVYPGAALIQCERIDEHTDLPLVKFTYSTRTRYLRVTKMDDKYIEGFDKRDEGKFKRFCRDSIEDTVELVELPQKK